MSEVNTRHGAPSWIEHQGSSPDEARKFYGKVLDWKIDDMPMKDGSSYPGIFVGDGPVGGINPRPSSSGDWLLYITVDDVDRRFEAAVEAGGEAVSEPMTIPGVGRMATIRDPFGASVAFIHYEAESP